jgi:hypothetical protein
MYSIGDFEWRYCIEGCRDEGFSMVKSYPLSETLFARIHVLIRQFYTVPAHNAPSVAPTWIKQR